MINKEQSTIKNGRKTKKMCENHSHEQGRCLYASGTKLPEKVLKKSARHKKKSTIHLKPCGMDWIWINKLCARFQMRFSPFCLCFPLHICDVFFLQALAAITAKLLEPLRYREFVPKLVSFFHTAILERFNTVFALVKDTSGLQGMWFK